MRPRLYDPYGRPLARSRATLHALPPGFQQAVDERRAHWRRLAAKMPERFHWINGEPVPILGGAAANTSPLFALVPNIGFGTVTAANTATDGTGTVTTIFTAGTNGSRVDRVRLVPLGTNAASKAYIFINNGGAQGTAANNALLIDIPLPITTASNTLLIGAPVEIAVAWPLKATFVINVTLATAVAAGWKFTAIGGDY
jgi:hypothetical protein